MGIAYPALLSSHYDTIYFHLFLIQIRASVPSLLQYFLFQSLLTALWFSHQTEAFVLSFFSAGSWKDKDWSWDCGWPCFRSVLWFIQFGHELCTCNKKILLVLKSYLIQNSWNQIVDVLVLKALWDSLHVSCPIALLLNSESFSIKISISFQSNL
jgi:hypothetical protein